MSVFSAEPPTPPAARGATEGTGALGHHVRGLDGLRAVAVGFVLLYHGEIPWARGGFLGISLFFTLSGFLITSMLLRSHAASGRIDLRQFWARRFRRLLPAAYLTLAGVVVFGATVATRQQLADLPGAIASALAQVTNWFFIVTGRSYVALFSAPSPVQHFWSLAIEEQFYLIMPVALLLLLRRTRSLMVVAGVLAAGVLASTVTMITLFERGASLDRLYYGTDTRAAELLVGALLAVVLHARPIPTTGRLRRALPAVGIAAIAVLVWGFTQLTLTDSVLYRGGFLVFACASAALIVSVLGAHGPVAATLAVPPLSALGIISYGVYLVHWPLFLWLTEERTGLDVWPLLLLRLTVTFGLAVASYHLLEMPVRRGACRGLARNVRWVIPAGAVILILVGAVSVGQRTVGSNLAGLGEAPTAVPSAARQDGVLDVLVITDSPGAPLGPALRSLAAARRDLRIEVAPRFSCAGTERFRGAPICSNWRNDWPALVDDFDPDVVLFHVTDWAVDDIAARSGSSDLAAQTKWTTEALVAGFDLLSAKGATIVWSQDPVDIPEALRREREPFYPAILRVTSERSDTHRREIVGQDTGPLLDDLALYRRRGSSSGMVVMVVGDSTARSLSYGLERWAAKQNGVAVWSAATEGCGIADEGRVPDALGREVRPKIQCRGVVEGLRRTIKKVRPDMVVVSSSLFDLSDRRLAGWPGLLAPGDRRFDDYLVGEYVNAYDVFSASGAKVVWVKSPCTENKLTGDDSGAYHTQRIKYTNDVILGRVARQRPDLRFFNMFDVLCPDGVFVEGLDGVAVLRTDGVHFSSEGSNWFAAKYGRQLLDLGRG